MISKNEYRKKTGNENSVASSFYSNKIVNVFEKNLRNISFDIPEYTTFGGSDEYYSQNPNTIFTNVSTPFVRFNFTGNTHSLSGLVDIIHETYKLDYETYKKYNPNFTKDRTDGEIKNDTTTQKETVYDESGIKVSEKTTILETNISAQTEVFEKYDITTFDEIQKKIENPFLEDVFKASGVTTPIYDYVPGQFVKVTGETSAKTASYFREC